ncbi:MAG: type II toxin-antitoxin system death-on-curing family toxin [Chloroflexota bacterium]|nr:type II toxin-antitoxin system death-on-curing family toxin [Chloroflexota bacterium]
MESLTYLSSEEAIRFHADTLGLTWEQATNHLLGGGMDKLESALARPRQYAAYTDADLAMQAAVLAHGIVEAHAFQDGNKRTAHVALRVFLAANGYAVSASQQERAAWLLRLARGETVEDIAAAIRRSLVPLA